VHRIHGEAVDVGRNGGGRVSLDEYKAFVEEVRLKSPLDVIVGESAELTRCGDKQRCRSPLREDRDPSFFVYDDGGWYDYGIKEGGDVFSYIQKKDDVSFSEAVKILAKRAGVTYNGGLDGGATKEVTDFIELSLERRYILRVLTTAAHFYHKTLAPEIREGIKNQYGFDDECIDRFKIGWSTGRGLMEHLLSCDGITREKAIKSGLFFQMPDGTCVEFFNSRIVFPYWNKNFVAYFIGRRVDGITSDADYEKAKYKKLLTHSEKHEYVSRYVANDVFFGEDSVVGHVDRLIVTEGVTDAISALNAGFPCISPVTVRFKDKDIAKLVEFGSRSKEIFVVNDEEEGKVHATTGRVFYPGLEGALKTAKAFFDGGLDARILRLPRDEGQSKVDLNSFLKDKGKDALIEAMRSALPYPQFLINDIPTDLPAKDINERLIAVAGIIAKCNILDQETYTNLIAKRFKMTKRVILNLIRKEGLNSIPPPASGGTGHEGEEGAWCIVGQIYEDDRTSRYYVNRPESHDIISSFVVAPREKIVIDGGGEVIKAHLYTDLGKVVEDVQFPPRCWRSKNDFKTNLGNSSSDLTWTGSDDNVQGLLRMISTVNVPKYRGTTALGYYLDKEGPRWVTPTMIIGPDGPIKDADLRYIKSGNSMEKRICYEFPPDEDVKRIAEYVMPRVMTMNTPDVTMPLIGWFMAAFVAPAVREIIGKFPLMWIFGTAGSGKTATIRDVMWQLCGVSINRDPFSVTDTDFVKVKRYSSTTSIPIPADEYKPRDMGKTKKDMYHRFMRRVHDGESEERGRADLGTNEYRLVAPACTMGESLPNETALSERMICVTPDKNELTPEHQKIFSELVNSEIAKLAGPLVKFMLTRDVSADMKIAKSLTDSILTNIGINEIPIRCKDNLIVMTLGIQLWDQFAGSLGVSLPQVDLLKAYKIVISNILGRNTSYVKDDADRFMEDLTIYAREKILQEGVHFKGFSPEIGKMLLCLDLKSCYNVYLHQKRLIGDDDETCGFDGLKRIMKEKSKRDSYVVSCLSDQKITIGDYRIRVVMIDFDKIPEDLDIPRWKFSSLSHTGKRDDYNQSIIPGTTEDK
jgi:DNA primase